MEKSSNIEDQVMDNLLRSYVKQQRPSEGTCQGFDVDLANLYLERVLTEKETSHYEIHLSICSLCRGSVVALARFAELEIPQAVSAPIADKQTLHAANTAEQTPVIESNVNWITRLQALLNVFTTPRFALAAVAILVLAISIPFIISQKGQNALNSLDKMPGAAEAPKSDAPSKTAQATSSGSGMLADAVTNKDQSATIAKSNSGEPEGTTNPSPGQPVVATDEAVGGAVAPPPTTEVATVRDNKKEEGKSDTATVAENKPRSDDAAGAGRASEPAAARAAAAPPAPDSSKVAATEGTELPRIDPKSTLRVPGNDKDAAAKTLKPGTSDGTVATANTPKGPTIRPGGASAQPPAASTESAKRTGVVADKKSLRDESDVSKERARASASRKIDNKTFWLLDDIWTDKDYKKNKELPAVTLIKDSDDYQEVLVKHSSLLKFFKGFAANEKVIVVYKGTVYKLIPRDGN